MPIDGKSIYLKVKSGHTSKYIEEVHCPLILTVMANEGRLSAFCVAVGMSERNFYHWVDAYPLFADCYSLGKMYARENWEKEGDSLRSIPYAELGCTFEHWRMVGWARFGVGKNPRIRLNLNPKDTPDKHYSQLLEAAKNGEYTAGEIKQLMEAVNVGLKADENFRLQEQLNAIKSDVDKLELIRNGQNSSTNSGIAQKSKDTLAGGLCGPDNNAR